MKCGSSGPRTGSHPGLLTHPGALREENQMNKSQTTSLLLEQHPQNCFKRQTRPKNVMPAALGDRPPTPLLACMVFLPGDSSLYRRKGSRKEAGCPVPTTLRGSPAPGSGHSVRLLERKGEGCTSLTKTSCYSHFPPRPELKGAGELRVEECCRSTLLPGASFTVSQPMGSASCLGKP